MVVHDKGYVLNNSTDNLTLPAGATVDLQLHTIYSDGTWQPGQLLEHLIQEGFGLAAITDHDRVDTVAALQLLAAEKHMPLLVATEMSTRWRGQAVDALCYGFEPEQTELRDLTAAVLSRQQANTSAAYEHLRQSIFECDETPELSADLRAILAKPAAQQPHELVALLQRQGMGYSEAWRVLVEAGVRFETNDIAAVVDAAHRSGAVCMIAHPGREDGFMYFDADLLDQLRREVPVDGLEAYYPKHTPEQTSMYRGYAQKHDLLVSAGSDSHGPDKPPISYPAHLCRSLLERLGVRVEVQ